MTEETALRLARSAIRFQEADEDLRTATTRAGGAVLLEAAQEYVLARIEHQQSIAAAEAEEGV